ncbi:hypothetical protein ACFQ38_00210 [Sporosarcina contaminans]|uniref:rRNA biogenesis protein rrp5 n=1 Tax=Sporosarcina contaminans TaxID=633403 RepID=A0ABW3TTK6_9BACL
MNLKITIDAPELAGAIESLAAALSSMNNPLPLTTPATAKQEETKEIDKSKQDKPKAETKKQDAPAKEETKQDPVKEAPKQRTKSEPTPTPEAEGDEKAEQLISLEVVRGKLADFSAGGKENQKQVVDALSRFGVKKLTDVNPADYKKLLELVGLSV